MKLHLLDILVIALLVASCSTPSDNPDEPVTSETPQQSMNPATDPRPGDDDWVRAPAYVDSTDLLVMESYPLQYDLNVKGSLPTPCHQLRVRVDQPDRQGNIVIEAYSVANPDRMCAQVLAPFEVNLSLGSYPPGKYQLHLNGEVIGELNP